MSRQRWYEPRTTAVVVAVAALLVLVLAVWTRHDLPRIDSAVNHFLGQSDETWLFRAAGWPARLGASDVVIPVGGAVAAWISFRRRSVVPLLVVAVALGLAAAPVSILKPILHRPEPGDANAELGRSYPSGHATSAAAISMVLSALALAGPPWPSPSPRSRKLMLATAATVPLVVGLTMFVRRAHWLTDVVAGYAIAGAAVMVAMTAAAWWERRSAGPEVISVSGPKVPPPGPDGRTP